MFSSGLFIGMGLFHMLVESGEKINNRNPGTYFRYDLIIFIIAMVAIA